MTIELTSDAFSPGGTIPKKFTADGADVSPPLRWANVPAFPFSLEGITRAPTTPSPKTEATAKNKTNASFARGEGKSRGRQERVLPASARGWQCVGGRRTA